jgi:hypothetical protein
VACASEQEVASQSELHRARSGVVSREASRDIARAQERSD